MWAETFVPVRQLCQGATATLALCSLVSDPSELVVVKELRRKPSPHASVELPAAAAKSADSMQQEYDVTRLLRKLGGHRHVVTVKSLHTFANDHTAVVMEYCADGDLFSYLERQVDRRFDEQQALRFFRQAVLGVQFLHANGIAHRDLALENLLLTGGASELKICDFGLSTCVHVSSTERVGRFNYMAPEVVLGVAYSPARADIWSLGIVLFILLTGSPLCEIAESPDPMYDALQQVGVSGILAHWQLHHLFSRSVLDLLSDLLQHDPPKRIASADEILARLDGFAKA